MRIGTVAGQEKLDHILRKALKSVRLPDSFQAARCRAPEDSSGCGSPMGDINRSGVARSSRGTSQQSSSRSGNHGWLGQTGQTKTRVDFSRLIFLSHLKMKQGGKRKRPDSSSLTKRHSLPPLPVEGSKKQSARAAHSKDQQKGRSGTAKCRACPGRLSDTKQNRSHRNRLSTCDLQKRSRRREGKRLQPKYFSIHTKWWALFNK